MSAYEFLLALGFWQWVGVLCLAGIAAQGFAAGVVALAALFKKQKP